MSVHLSVAVDTRQWQAMCLLVDLHTRVAEAHHEFVTSGGWLDGATNTLADIHGIVSRIEALVPAQDEGVRRG